MRIPLVSLGLGLSLMVTSGLRAQESVDARLSALEAAMANQEGSNDFRVFWKDGLHFETADKSVTLKMGGRIMWDTTWFGEDDNWKAISKPDGSGPVGAVPNGTEFRRARFYTSGTMGKHVFFKLQIEFAGGSAAKSPLFADAYIGLKHVPGVQLLKFGRFKEYMGLEELTSSRYITFMERSVTSSLLPARQSGVGAEWLSESKRLLIESGVFMTTNNNGRAQADGNGAFTARVAGQPFWESKTNFIHMAGSISYRNSSVDGYRFRNDLHQDPSLGATQASDGTLIYGMELAWNKGPLSLQGEYVGKEITGATSVADSSLKSFYVQGSWFLTAGDGRSYKQAYAVFNRVKPRSPLAFGGDNSGMGAWELALRYDWLDTTDGAFASTAGGIVNYNITTGVNWYWNNNARVMFNYVYSSLDPQGLGGNSGKMNALGVRFQIDWYAPTDREFAPCSKARVPSLRGDGGLWSPEIARPDSQDGEPGFTTKIHAGIESEGLCLPSACAGSRP